ncbi:MAG TPA: 6,7-dimethyl-8-ribityllumazine synthase [Candidatus Acidoferrales bacterium]|nr:6,7-dimethyl-8-ribityllumazine synthase [Candidatus Acidoferrales bacterium]
MARIIEGKLDARGLRFGIIVSRFNAVVTEKLLAGALDALKRHGGAEENIDIVRVPGCFEIPLTARRLAASGKYDALVCLGAVIRGETAHFEHVANAAARGVARAMDETKVPIAFGVLTTYTMEQALARAGAEMDNKGFEAALVAIEMANLNRVGL